MFLRLLQLICLFEIVTNLTIKDYPLQQNGETGMYLLSNKNTQDIYFKKNPIHISWHDIILFSTLILLFLTLLICLYYQRLLTTYIFNLRSKRQTNNNDINKHVTLLEQTSPLGSTSSSYLTVPQPSHYHH